MARNTVTRSTFSTSTGQTAVAGFANPATVVTAVMVSATTHPIVWRIQGSLGVSGLWQNLNAAATTSTGSIMVTSTLGAVVDKARVDISASSSTAGGSVYVLGV